MNCNFNICLEISLIGFMFMFLISSYYRRKLEKLFEENVIKNIKLEVPYKLEPLNNI